MFGMYGCCILSKRASFGKCVYFVFFRPAFPLWVPSSQAKFVGDCASASIQQVFLFQAHSWRFLLLALLPPARSPVCPHSGPVMASTSTPRSPRHASTPALCQPLVAAHRAPLPLFRGSTSRPLLSLLLFGVHAPSRHYVDSPPPISGQQP